MDIWSWFQEVAILIAVYEITAAKSSFLESLQFTEGNPPELNDFLAAVAAHKKDFSLARQAARKYQKIKKDTYSHNSFNDLFNDFDDYKRHSKRYVHHSTPHRKFRTSGLLPPNMRNNFGRTRRHIEENEPNNQAPETNLNFKNNIVHKRMPSPESSPTMEKHIPSDIFTQPRPEAVEKREDRIVVESDGEKGVIEGNNKKEKKQVFDVLESIHKSYKSPPHRNEKQDQQSNLYYVDLEKAAAENMERHNERRYDYNNPHGREYISTRNEPLHRKLLKPETIDYPEYGNARHDNLNDKIAFEKALSYEIEPKTYNNPSGNSLLSVDMGQPDRILYSQGVYADKLHDLGYSNYQPQDAISGTNEHFLIENDNIKRIGTTTDNVVNINLKKNDDKTVKQVGNGFIEVTKGKRSDEGFYEPMEYLNHGRPLEKMYFGKNEDIANKENKPSVLFKHSLHPLKTKEVIREDYDEENDNLQKREVEQSENMYFQQRKLRFFDYENLPYGEEFVYEDVPQRPRRDFLDALGMKNEEDYSEDNPNKNMEKVNNTDVNNDTCIIHNITTVHPCGRFTTSATTGHPKEDVNNIKTILEEPKEIINETVGNIKKSKQKKRYHRKEADSKRIGRTDTEITDKILRNKQRIYKNENNNQNVLNHIHRRSENGIMSNIVEEMAKLTNFDPSLFEHRIDKKEETSTSTTEMMTTTAIPLDVTTKYSTSENQTISSHFEEMANQIDQENEKLAQVVNGRLASKIVCSVFEELKKNTALKSKLYSGLSRKHVDFAENMDGDIFKNHETEDVAEARLLLDKMTKVLNRLVMSQVRRKLCQRIPDDLKDYLDIILNVRNTLETINFQPNTDQGKFLFSYQTKDEPPFDVKKLQDILVDLEGLLLHYNSMNSECQGRAEPIKDYIEKHVHMLKQIIACPTHNCGGTKRDLHESLLDEQLQSVGLNKGQEFIPNFDIGKLVKDKMKENGWKTDKKRDTSKRDINKSDQYKKLEVAAEKIREKRENDEKIAEVFGGKVKRSPKFDVDYEEPVVYSLG